MPFGLDIKSIILGILLAMFVVPWLTATINRPRATVAT